MFTIPKQIVLPVGEYTAITDFAKVTADKINLVKFGQFNAADIKGGKVYVQKAADAVLASFTVSGATATTDTFRVSMDVTTNHLELSDFARANTRYKGKPLSIEFKGAANLTPILAKAIKGTSFERYLEVALGGVIKAKSGHINLEDCMLEKLNPATQEFEIVGEAESSLGTPAFGDYDYILHNLHLPSINNTYPLGEQGWGMPVKGIKYDQYTFEVTTDRGAMGLGAVGQNVTSTMTHCLYVPQMAPFASDALATELKKATGVEVVDALTGAAVPAA